MPSPKVRLLNKKSLAEELGVDRDFVTRMCFAGFDMPGGRSTAAWALDWLKKHPDFKPTRPRKPRDKKVAKPSLA